MCIRDSYKYGEAIRKRSKFAPTEPKKDEESAVEAEEIKASDRSSSQEDEAALDEEMGVPDQSDVEHEIEKERSKNSPEQASGTGDRYLDPSGLEKAE